MKFRNFFKSFKNDESGAVTVDWVVLTAAIVGLGLAVMNTIKPAVNSAGARITTDITNAASRPAP